MAEELIGEAVGKSNGSMVVLGIGIGLGIGFTAGYFYAHKSAETKYSKISDKEIAEMKAHYDAKIRASEEKKPLDEVMKDQGYTTKLEGPEETVWVKVEPAEQAEEAEEPPEPSLSAGEGDVWDYEVELAQRQEGVPYVIHYDEWRENEKDYRQIQVTYFEGDDTLSDDRDGVIDDQDAHVGLGNLSKFGHGSDDAMTVYVRNDELEIDYEITYSQGRYATEVQGYEEDELRHSQRIPRRRRGFDDD